MGLLVIVEDYWIQGFGIFHNCYSAQYGVCVLTGVGLKVFGNVKSLNTEGPLVEKNRDNEDSQEQRVKEL
jgi:hypothetical protein